MRLELLPATDDERTRVNAVAATLSKERLRGQLVLIAGLGNIGSPLAMLLAPVLAKHGARLRLIDRDVVEWKNFSNQWFLDRTFLACPKVDAVASLIRHRCPEIDLDVRYADLEDLPFADFAEASICLGALDSLRARQMLISERAWPLGIPVIDGGVGEGALGRVQVIVPGAACIECGWGQSHYRQLATEYPCSPERPIAGPPTNAPAFVGTAVATQMASECLRWLSGETASNSFEVSCDLSARRMAHARLRRAAACRADHRVVTEVRRFESVVDRATLGQLTEWMRCQFPAGFQAETRCGVWKQLRTAWPLSRERVFADVVSWAADEEFTRRPDLPLRDLGLTARDRLRVRPTDGQPDVWVTFTE